jgi:hypothetical protein
MEDEKPFLAAAKKRESPVRKILPLLENLNMMWSLHERPKDDPAYTYGLPVSPRKYEIFFAIRINLFTFQFYDLKHISCAHTEEDYGKIEWPSHEALTLKSWMWIILQDNKWQYPY